MSSNDEEDKPVDSPLETQEDAVIGEGTGGYNNYSGTSSLL